MLQRSQLLAGPVSGVLMGLLTSLLYTRPLGWAPALMAGGVLAVLLGAAAAWMAYRSDFGARHVVVGSLLYLLLTAPFAAGANLMLVQMAGAPEWFAWAWTFGLAAAIVPVLGPAWRVRARLSAEGGQGPWASRHLDLRAGVLKPDALAAMPGQRPSMTGWQVGALAANVPLLWRLQGGNDTGLLSLAMVLMVIGLVWAGVAQLGPALGKAWFLLELERRTGQRLRHPQWDEIQALRRSHWLARWFVRDA